MKKTIGRFFMYLGIIVGVCVTAVLICGVVLMTVPNSSIFGVRYVKLDKSYDFSYDEAQFLNAEAVLIKTNRMDINIEPSADDKLRVSYSEGLSGFVNAGNAKVTCSTEVVQWSFNDNAGGAYNNIDTVMIVFEEPDGWIFENGNEVTLYLPSNMTPKVVSVHSRSGEINFAGETGDKKINETELLMAMIESGGSSIVINYPKSDRYILKTDSGTATFKNYSHTQNSVMVNSIDADIEFITSSGAFDVSNSKKNGTINGDVRITSASGTGGPRFVADIINGNLTVISKTGFVTVGQLGAENNNVDMKVFSTNVSVDIKKVYATILSLPMDNEEPRVNYKIEELYTAALSEIESGKGNINITKITGDVKLVTTSGAVRAENVNGNVSASTVSGAIDIIFDEAAGANELKITTKEGEINAGNIKGKLDILISGEGRDKKMTLKFLKVVKGSTISGRGYNIDLTTRVGSDIYMLICSTPVTKNASQGLFSTVLESAPDYVQNFYSYRVGYTVWNDERVNDNIGKILITKSQTKGNVVLNGII